MKAAIRKGWLGFSYAFTDEQPQPIFQPSGKNRNDVLLKINAAAINPIDYKLPRLAVGPIFGTDCCGTIVAIGNGATESGYFEVGDLVYGKANSGSVAEYAVASTSKLAKVRALTGSVKEGKEGKWTPVQYAALSVPYQSALQCLRKGGILKDADVVVGRSEASNNGRAVLVIGASGGCGVAGLQLLKAIGGVSRRVAICSKANEVFVRDMGATEVVDYTNGDELDGFYKDNVGKFDMVYDVATNSGAGEDYWDRSIPLLKPSTEDYNGGEYVALNGSSSKWIRALSGFEKKRQSLVLCKPNTNDLELIVSLLNRTGDRPVTNIVLLDEDGVHQAIGRLKSRRTRGKIVFNISPSTS